MVIDERERARRVTNSSRHRRGIAVCIRRLICIHRFERLISRLLTLSGLSVCQECRPTCRASPSAIDHPSLSIRSAATVRYRSFADIDRESRFQFHIRAPSIRPRNLNSIVLGSTMRMKQKGDEWYHWNFMSSLRVTLIRGNFAIEIFPRRSNNRLLESVY